MLSTDQIETRLNNIDTKLRGIVVQIDRVNADLSNKVNIPDLSRSIEELRELIRVSAQTIQELEEKLTKIILPEDTRLYLAEGEVQNFQSNFNTLRAMMTKFDKLYKNLVSYQANISSN